LLNDAKVRAAKPREKAYKLTDSNRLFLLVTPSGGKLWRWNYSYDGKQKSMSFGIYPYQYGADEVRVQDNLPIGFEEKRQFFQTNAETVFNIKPR